MPWCMGITPEHEAVGDDEVPDGEDDPERPPPQSDGERVLARRRVVDGEAERALVARRKDVRIEPGGHRGEHADDEQRGREERAAPRADSPEAVLGTEP